MKRKRQSANPVRGGPRSAAGKARSRLNALKHGLTSTKLIPEIINKVRVQEFREQLRQHYGPGDPTQCILVDELARHAAMMELGEKAEGSVLRHGARELCKVILGSSEDDDPDEQREDMILSAAVSTDALDKFSRYRRGHEKAFYSALNKLGELQSARRAATDTTVASCAEDQGLFASGQRFANEAACLEHLRARFRQPGWRCPHCGHERGSWLDTRRRWECGGCRRQVGLRYGTVMHRSRLPLCTWFAGIELVAADPGVATNTLAEKVGIKRRETVRKMRAKILAALASPDAQQLLVGLVADSHRDARDT